MAFSKKYSGETMPEKVVIVTGPTLGTVLGFIALGAAVGAAVAWVIRSKMDENVSEEDAIMAGITGGGAKDTRNFVDRLNKIGHRLKSIASRTRDTVHSAAETLGPVVKQAMQEARHSAEEIEEDLKSEIDKAAATTQAHATAQPASATPQAPG